MDSNLKAAQPNASVLTFRIEVPPTRAGQRHSVGDIVEGHSLILFVIILIVISPVDSSWQHEQIVLNLKCLGVFKA
jgi:hypothetical protein